MKGTLRTAQALPRNPPTATRRSTAWPAAVLALVLVGAAVTFVQATEEPAAGPAVVCHAPPPGEANHTLNVGQPAADAHAGHGDGTGACDEAEADAEGDEPLVVSNATTETASAETGTAAADDGYGTQPVPECACHHADVAVEQEALLYPGGYGEDGRVDFRIKVHSLGGLTAENVTLVDHLPDFGGTWVLAGPDAGACAIDAGMLTCSFGDLAEGASRTVVASSALCSMECGTVVNTAIVQAANDSEATNDSAVAELTRESGCPGA